jgi:phytanoyl-CoA dioxygenase PhyH
MTLRATLCSTNFLGGAAVELRVFLGGKMLSDEQLKAVETLRAQQPVISENEIDSLFQKAVDCEYWRALCPEMGVMTQRDLNYPEPAPLSSEQAVWTCGHLERHGYFHIPGIISPAVVAPMYKSAETVRSSGWPSVFSFVYDEFWTIMRTPSLVNFLSRKLGTGYLQTAPICAYRVDPHARASGKPPHVDSEKDEERLSVWIPLSDATISNGCIYVIPQDRVPPSLPASYLDWTTVSRDELGVLLHNVIPVPATVGSVLGWNNRLIHWGGRALEPSAFPRLSVAAEFMSVRATPRNGETPVFDLALPDFATRLRVIGQSMLRYENLPVIQKYRGLATKLIDWKS